MVCEATQCTDANVRKAAYEAIWTIATLYYDRLQAYMQPLFELTLKTIREDQEDVALNAMEFWSSLCDEEVGFGWLLLSYSTFFVHVCCVCNVGYFLTVSGSPVAVPAPVDCYLLCCNLVSPCHPFVTAVLPLLRSR